MKTMRSITPRIPFAYRFQQKETMKTETNLVKRLAIYCEGGGVIRVCGDWSVADLSYHYPISSTTGIDSLLYCVSEEERDTATIEFYDVNNRVIPDPRIYMEDLN